MRTSLTRTTHDQSTKLMDRLPMPTGYEAPEAGRGVKSRIAGVERDIGYLRRGYDEMRTDVRKIWDRLGSIDATLSVLSEKFSSISGALEQRPTKLHVAKWACGALVCVLAFATGVISMLAMSTGHPDAAKRLDAARGK